MAFLWTVFVGWLQAGLFALAHMYGGSIGLAIITLSFILRLALLPLTLRVAQRARWQQIRMHEMEPELNRLKKRYASDSELLTKKTLELYRKHKVQPVDGLGFLGSLLQLPIFAGLFSAIRQGLGSGGRFLWITDITQPDLRLTIMVALLTFVSSVLAPNTQPQGRMLFMLLPAILTLVFMWRLSAGLGLYWAASTLVGMLQAVLLRRRMPV